jgi:hypothetical protein
LLLLLGGYGPDVAQGAVLSAELFFICTDQYRLQSQQNSSVV